MEKLLEEKMYESTRKGISMCTDSYVTIIGERTVMIDGRIIEQYLYNIDGYVPENGKPFVSMKANIIVL